MIAIVLSIYLSVCRSLSVSIYRSLSMYLSTHVSKRVCVPRETQRERGERERGEGEGGREGAIFINGRRNFKKRQLFGVIHC